MYENDYKSEIKKCVIDHYKKRGIVVDFEFTHDQLLSKSPVTIYLWNFKGKDVLIDEEIAKKIEGINDKFKT